MFVFVQLRALASGHQITRKASERHLIGTRRKLDKKVKNSYNGPTLNRTTAASSQSTDNQILNELEQTLQLMTLVR